MSNSRKESPDQTEINLPPLSANVLAGLFTGVFCSGLFNPWDRALYLSVKNNQPFLSAENFRHPYHGFSQAVVQRAFLGSVYYILQGEFKTSLHPYLRERFHASESMAQFCVGMSAGAVSGLFTNSISAIKYHTWGLEQRSFLSSTFEMWKQGGIQPFIKGTWATISRDTVFGSTYEVSRYLMRQHIPHAETHTALSANFVFDCLSAALATITSGPLNYARTMQYAASPHTRPPTTLEALRQVWAESRNQPTALSRLGFFQNQFRVGWGTARVAVGMAVGQYVFDEASARLKKR